MFHPVWDKPNRIKPGQEGPKWAHLPGLILEPNFPPPLVSTGWKRCSAFDSFLSDFKQEFDCESMTSDSDDCFGEHVCSEEQSRARGMEFQVDQSKTLKFTRLSLSLDLFEMICFFRMPFWDSSHKIDQTPARPLPSTNQNKSKLVQHSQLHVSPGLRQT